VRRLMATIIGFLVLVLFLSACNTNSAPAEPLRIACPPNPNMIPLFVAMDRHQENLNIELVPVPGVPELAAAVQGGQADVALFFSAAGAKQFNKGTLTSLRLWNVNVWRALYLVAEPRFDSLESLRGQKILASFPGGAPDLVMRAAMRQAGYDPDTDFVIEYLPSAQVQQLLLAGQGQAALLPEPQVTALISKAAQQGQTLQPAVDLQAGFSAENWEADYIPLGGVFVTEALASDADRRAALEQFIAAYDEAAAYAMSHPAEAGEITARAFKEYFGGQLPAEAVISALENGRLVFNSRPVAALRPDLDQFLALIVGQAPADEFYAAP